MADVDVAAHDAGPDAGPVPLSFPALLRNPKLSNRFAHLHIPSQDSPHQSHQRRTNKDRLEPEGKRWVRRRENAKFTHNPHIALPTSLDFAHPLQVPSSTFPHPLPTYLPRTLPVPPSRPPPSLPSTSSAGLFSLSLRGARRALRARASSAYLVKVVETHLTTWLEGGTYLNPDQAKGLLRFPGDPVGDREDIREVGREAGRLVWAVKVDTALGNSDYRDGAFERYVVHCVARWYGVVSFSKETDGYRLTYLLRPNILRPDPRVNAASRTLNTPPTTDASDFLISDASLSDFNATDASDYNTTDTSDIDSVLGDLPTRTRALSDIQESRPSSPASWSVPGGSDSDIDADDHGFAASMESLSLSTHAEFDDFATPTRLRNATISAQAGSPADTEPHEQGENPTSSRARANRDRLRTLYPRSASSPSPARRSPHRLYTARKLGARRKRKAENDNKVLAGAVGTGKGSFYDYLFA
ncbi:hypothetical protein J3R82DRAFT_10642 [Butyriboletus roseoflavus]|nr:hypothetical protein J3R82DRAFT_10642 [Butyriboletus roseoflavus]